MSGHHLMSIGSKLYRLCILEGINRALTNLEQYQLLRML